MKDFWVMTVSPRWKKKKKRKKKQPVWFFCEYLGVGGRWRWGGEERGGGAARLGYSLCQGYKQAVIRLPNRIILPVSAPKHMGPHKAAAAPDRHPLLITQRRGAGPFFQCLSLLRFTFSPSGCLGNIFILRCKIAFVIKKEPTNEP